MEKKRNLPCSPASFKLKVIKRDGKAEKFDPKKIARVVKAAGLEKNKAGLFANKVADWAKTLTKNSVSSLKIRDKVLEELKKVDQYAAGLYEWYGKNKASAYGRV